MGGGWLGRDRGRLSRFLVHSNRLRLVPLLERAPASEPGCCGFSRCARVDYSRGMHAHVRTYIHYVHYLHVNKLG